MPDEQPSEPTETTVPEEAETPVDPTPASLSTSSDSSESSSGEQLASDFKKAELKTAAEVVGADVPAKATKADIAQAIVDAQPAAQPVVVDNHTARDDNDARFGQFVDVVDGEHKGRVGHYFETVEHDLKTGYPTRVLVRSRDALNELLDVAYEHVRPSRFTGGR